MTARPYGGVTAEERRSDRRRRLLDAGYDLLAAAGSAAVTVTGVCKGAGLTTRYFYEQFESREVLLEALLAEEADAVIAQIFEAVVSGPSDPPLRAAAGITALLEALEADPRRAALGREAEDDDLLVLTRAKVVRRMAHELVTHGSLVLPDANRARLRVAAPIVITGVLQIVSAWLEGHAAISRDQVVETAVRFSFATADVLLA